MGILLAALLSFVGPKNVQCLTEAIYYEAGNQSILGKLSVGRVIQNRVNDRRWPETYCEVIKQPYQFSYYWDGQPETLPRKNNKFERRALRESEWVALFILATPFLDITNGALYYHSNKVQPSWVSNVSYHGTFGDHLMYTD